VDLRRARQKSSKEGKALCGCFIEVRRTEKWLVRKPLFIKQVSGK
jgi:hypothetical protein